MTAAIFNLLDILPLGAAVHLLQTHLALPTPETHRRVLPDQHKYRTQDIIDCCSACWLPTFDAVIVNMLPYSLCFPEDTTLTRKEHRGLASRHMAPLPAEDKLLVFANFTRLRS